MGLGSFSTFLVRPPALSPSQNEHNQASTVNEVGVKPVQSSPVRDPVWSNHSMTAPPPPPPPQCPIIAELSNVYRLFNDFLRFVAKSIKQNKLFFQTFYLLSHQNQSLRIRSELCFVFQSHQLAGVERREETHKARPVRHQQQGMVSWDLILSSRPSDGLVLSTFNCSHKSSKRFSMRLSSPCILSVNVYKHFLALKQPMIYLTIFRRPVFCL